MTLVPYWQWRVFRRAIGRKNRFRPFSIRFGFDRGRPIDRVYIEQFLATEANAIRGRVLEIGEDLYTTRFGAENVAQCVVLHAKPDNPRADIVADLAHAPQIPSDSFDCIILTQVLPFVRDPCAVVGTLRRILRPGGAVLATIPFITAVSIFDRDQWGDFWRFTSMGAQHLFDGVFGGKNVKVTPRGNLVVASAFLYGFAEEDLTPEDFEPFDPMFEIVSLVKAVKTAPEASAMDAPPVDTETMIQSRGLS